MVKCACQMCSAEISVEPRPGALPKYCEACKRKRKSDYAKERAQGKLRNKSTCSQCGTPIDKTNAPSKLYCDPCSKAIRKVKTREATDKYRRKQGVKVGVGSGKAQGSGKAHHAYKNGSAFYRAIVKERGDTQCNRCNVDIDFSQRYKWVVHHRDHNRANNESDNLELLCKCCHQREHDCFRHKEKNHNVSY